MSTNRIATFPATDRIILANMGLQTSLNDVQVQLSTGLKSVNYKGIASDTQRLLSVEKNDTNLKNYNANGTVVAGNINIAFNSVKSILDLSNNFLSTLTQAQSGNFLDPQVTKNQGQILIQEVAGLLNVQSAGRYLFAGSKIDTPPVDLTAAAVQTSPSTADTSYYKGDNYTQSAQMSESLTVKYGFTANNPAFEQLLRGLNLAINNSGNKTALAEAEGLIQSSVSGMSNIFSQLNTFARTVDNQTARNNEDMAAMQSVIGDLKGIDIAATTVKQNEIEAQLQSSYAASVKIMNLKLSDYL